MTASVVSALGRRGVCVCLFLRLSPKPDPPSPAPDSEPLLSLSLKSTIVYRKRTIFAPSPSSSHMRDNPLVQALILLGAGKDSNTRGTYFHEDNVTAGY